MGLLIQPFLGIVVKILAAKVTIFQTMNQIFSLKNQRLDLQAFQASVALTP